MAEKMAQNQRFQNYPDKSVRYVARTHQARNLREVHQPQRESQEKNIEQINYYYNGGYGASGIKAEDVKITLISTLVLFSIILCYCLARSVGSKVCTKKWCLKRRKNKEEMVARRAKEKKEMKKLIKNFRGTLYLNDIEEQIKKEGVYEFQNDSVLGDEDDEDDLAHQATN